MTTALHLPLTGEPVATTTSGHGGERAVAEALGLIAFAPAPLPPPLPKLPAQNFFARHWRGEYSLARSFWINHLLLGATVGAALTALAAAIDRGAVEQPVRWLISLGLTWSVIILFTIWDTVGIWRAATAYRRSGKRYWGAAAKAIVWLAMFNLVCSVLVVALPQAAGIWEIVDGDKRIGPHRFKVMNNGTMLDFSGGISFGTAKEFETMLNAMDQVRTVRLNSGGGRVAEAQKISDLIRARGLSTFVTHECASACTIVFLGGKQRFLLSTARLGFHQPSFPGMTERDHRIAIAREQARLQYLGLSRGFAERANTASPSGMWYPEASELLRERVVTTILTPQPPKPPTTAQPAPAAQATQTAYQGVPL